VLANFGVSGPERIAAEVRAALERTERARLVARAEAERRLHTQLAATLAKVLHSAERQLHHRHLPAEVAEDARHIRRLVAEMRAALGASEETAPDRAAAASGGGRARTRTGKTT
jgi:hypothetical protein